jgi:hypothetical protein
MNLSRIGALNQDELATAIRTCHMALFPHIQINQRMACVISIAVAVTPYHRGLYTKYVMNLWYRN